MPLLGGRGFEGDGVEKRPRRESMVEFHVSHPKKVKLSVGKMTSVLVLAASEALVVV